LGTESWKVLRFEIRGLDNGRKKWIVKAGIYLGSDFAGKKLYVVRIFDGSFITDNENLAREVEKSKEEFLREGIEKLFYFLGEPSTEEIKEAVERLRRRKFSSIQT
jgi:hypothetical protein